MANDRLPIRILSIANTLPILEVLIPINMYNPVSFCRCFKKNPLACHIKKITVQIRTNPDVALATTADWSLSVS